MAITYNGTAITSATYNRTNYKSISYNGCVAYVNTRVCWLSNAFVCYSFQGFDYKACGGGTYARAKVCILGDNDMDSCLEWDGTEVLANCTRDLILEARSTHHMSCVCLLFKGCGHCGTTYTLPVTNAPFEIRKADPDDEDYFGMTLYSDDAYKEGAASGFVWKYGGCYLYGDWVRIDICDYNSRLTCTGLTLASRPIIYLSCVYACYYDLEGNPHCRYYCVQSSTGKCTSGIVSMVLC